MDNYHHHHHLHAMNNLGSSRSSNSSSSSSTVHYQDQDQDHHDHDHDQSSEDDQTMMMMELRRGPWTLEEDVTLMNYIANHGEGRWNSLARSAGLKRTGKSCRLRWLNYLRPDVRRGNITLEEQLLILELHSRWGNRWSKIAQHLPGRTDNEIKNYWRTRVQKHAKQLKCDVNSKQFKDTMRYLWMPRLVERIQAASGGASTDAGAESCILDPTPYNNNNNNNHHTITSGDRYLPGQLSTTTTTTALNYNNVEFGGDNSSSDSFGAQVSPVSDLTTDQYNNYATATSTTNTNTNSNYNPDQYGYFQGNDQISNGVYYPDQSTLTSNNNNNNMNGFGQMINNPGLVDFQAMDHNQWSLDQSEMSLWNTADDVWFLQQQFNNTI